MGQVQRSDDFRAGQRVRIRTTADSEFAGYYGVIMHVGSDVCDVRIRYKPQGSKVRSTYIGTFNKADLESLRRPVDLALFDEQEQRPVLKQPWLWIGVAVVVVVTLTFFM